MKLYVVSTPIGNLDDISFRAVKALKDADIIAAEDTRRTRILLNHCSIRPKRIISYNEANEKKRIAELLSLATSEASVVLVSDSGTPCLSDPGFKLVREAVEKGVDVVPVPGPSAVLPALVASGLPTDSFAFYGFLPKKEGKKRALLDKIRAMDETVIVYESPYRIAKSLEKIAEIMPEKNICIAREITKRFEEFIRGKPAEVIEKIGKRVLKGEIVIVIGK
ncbi:16S rRNA (cytidine(1402)-2'-O)-methyltransferase [Candidatus Woesearchaeota archaeon]|nr:16S rRNA (cytidine(1402)-2'-O)-methyltransferase [Candidatus Woesearchaeota archaeon]